MNLAIIQARMGSTRFPGKVLSEILNKPLLGYLIERVARSKYIDEYLFATTTNKKDDELCDYFVKNDLPFYRGSEHDVLDRYYNAAKTKNPTNIIRLTGDCPLLDWEVIDKVIGLFQDADFDYVSNTDPPTFPDGLDTEIFTFRALEFAWNNAIDVFDREHVTPYLRRHNDFKKGNLENQTDHSAERWTVDTCDDFYVVKQIIEYFNDKKIDFLMSDILSLKKIHPEIFLKNKQYIRNEGAELNTGQKLFIRAKKVIPGGNSLLSKRPDMFLPGFWPCYFQKAKGIDIWDLDGNKFIDMSMMGIGTNILGYANDEVDGSVVNSISNSAVSTLNCPEEVYLAEKLVELHPWAEMVRFSRTGGEACTMAIRIARAATGKDQVAFCGYHGWHDWYLSSNISNDNNLDGQLLPGLEPKGVPRGLIDTVHPFSYNRIEELEEIVSKYDIGTIIMEPIRSELPTGGFLEKVRDIANRKNIVLIFDEVTTGFRKVVGGIHKTFNVNPDMAIFGKALGNGYPISSVIGKRKIMEAVQTTFISSTFWTERIGYTAALKTIEVMEREGACEKIDTLGEYLQNKLSNNINCKRLHLHVSGLPALGHFSVSGQDNSIIKTIITQEMLKKGYLAGTSTYVCVLHSKEVMDQYVDELSLLFEKIELAIKGDNLTSLIDHKVCVSGFKRLT